MTHPANADVVSPTTSTLVHTTAALTGSTALCVTVDAHHTDDLQARTLHPRERRLADGAEHVHKDDPHQSACDDRDPIGNPQDHKK